MVYDVFLSHRGPDVKKHFCGFLKEALHRAGVLAFVDEDDLKPGDEARKVMVNALESSRLVLPVLSKGYVESPWCLDELVLMMRKPEQVLPVFYHVDPDDVDALAEDLQWIQEAPADKLEEWADALKRVPRKTGWRADQTSGHMPQLVRNIVRDVLKTLGRPALHVADMPVDIETRVAAIKQLWAEQLGSAVIGLHGMGGIGKTTLAKALYNDLHAVFAGDSCFLEVGREAGKAELQQLQQQILKDVCGFEVTLTSLSQGRAQLEARLRDRCVLLVIDDIWRSEQLDALLISVGQGSRVAVTTRDGRLLRRPGIVSQPVDLLSESAALELFSCHAFLAREPPADYKALAAEAVTHCAGLPLTLAVLGAHLWERKDSRAWQRALDSLKAAKPLRGGKTEDDRLWGKLKLSYDALGDDEQQMFLDIACFMLARTKDSDPNHCFLGNLRRRMPKTVSRCLPAWGHFACDTLETLVNRSLVGIDASGHFAVHDQLADMGRAIVVKQNRAPALRSHVWMPEAESILDAKRGSDSIEAMSLHGYPWFMFSTAALQHTTGLRMLDLGEAVLDPLDGGLLGCGMRYLEWHNAWDDVELPDTLAVVDFSDSFLLTALPQSLSTLTGMVSLNLCNCSSLDLLPESVSALTGLELLDLRNCWHLQKLPEALGELTSLTRLDLDGCGMLAALPQSLSALTSLQVLRLSGCSSLRDLPQHLSALRNLQELNFYECHALTALPDSLSALTGLTGLGLSNANFRELPQSLGKLSGLKWLLMNSCNEETWPPDSLGDLTGLLELNLSCCGRLSQLPWSLGALTGLTKLNLSGCGSLVELPESLGALTDLTQLNLSACKSLIDLPCSVSALTSLKVLNLSECCNLATLPPTLSSLTGLEVLDLWDCIGLTKLPQSLRMLKGLMAPDHLLGSENGI